MSAPNAISIGSAVLAILTVVANTETPTDRPRCNVGRKRLYLALPVVMRAKTHRFELDGVGWRRGVVVSATLFSREAAHWTLRGIAVVVVVVLLLGHYVAAARYRLPRQTDRQTDTVP